MPARLRRRRGKFGSGGRRGRIRGSYPLLEGEGEKTRICQLSFLPADGRSGDSSTCLLSHFRIGLYFCAQAHRHTQWLRPFSSFSKAACTTFPLRSFVVCYCCRQPPVFFLISFSFLRPSSFFGICSNTRKEMKKDAFVPLFQNWATLAFPSLICTVHKKPLLFSAHHECQLESRRFNSPNMYWVQRGNLALCAKVFFPFSNRLRYLLFHLLFPLPPFSFLFSNSFMCAASIFSSSIYGSTVRESKWSVRRRRKGENPF